MMIRGKELALSVLAVGTAAVAGYVLHSDQQTDCPSRSKANLGARIIAREDVPRGATVVESTSQRLEEIPGARRVVERAIRAGADEEWAHVTIEHEGAWSVVDAVRGALPYYDGNRGEYNGVYIQYDGRFVVLDAFGWARLEEPLQ